jgi:TonB family protein
MPGPPQPTLTIWRAGTTRCGGEPVAATQGPSPLPTLGWSGTRDAPLRATFRIDATGRPLGIHREARRFGQDMGDMLPALAAARFATGVARNACSIVFTPDQLPVDDVPLAIAMAYTLFPTGSPAPEGLWRRIRPADTSCFEPAPAQLNRAYPDFTTIAGQRGRPLWSMVGYDIDADGKPVRIHTVSGSRSNALDAASRRAVKQSRFGKGARHGCLYPYWRIADPLPAPEPPARESMPAQPEACKALGAWVRAPRLVYPDEYRRRGIEGWAILSYDVAPWGALGNIKVIAAEPTADFGEAALNMFTGLSRNPSGTGASGCVERVRYVMGKPGMSLPAETGPSPLY